MLLIKIVTKFIIIENSPLTFYFLFIYYYRFVDGECGSSSGDSSTGQLELSGGEQPEEASPASLHETNNNSLLHEDLERRI
jgi:hypothetical protein